MFVLLGMSPSILSAKEPRKPHELEFGLMCYHFDYKEDLEPPYKSTESGWLPGFYFDYIHNDEAHNYSKVFIELTRANTDYDGTTMAGIPITGTTNNTFFRFEWDFGYNFETRAGHRVTPYAGYGYRYWKRGLGGAAPYREKYRWSYVPIGIKVDFKTNDKWNISTNFAMRFVFDGEMRVYFSDVDPNYNNPKVELGNKAGWFVELPIGYEVSTNLLFVGTPWYECSKIGRSNLAARTYAGTIDAFIYEPASTTHQYGINFGLTYLF